MASLARACRTAGLAALGLAVTLGLGAAQAPPQPVAGAVPPAAVGEPPAIAGIDARLEVTDRTARFTLTLSRMVDISIETIDQPMRIIADMPEVAFQSTAQSRRAGALVTQFRAGLVAPGRSRIVFDLEKAASIKAMRQTPRADGIVDLVIEFEPASRSSFEKAVAEGAERRAAQALAPLVMAPPQPSDRRALVVIDPGHGGIDPGAVAKGGVTEKSLVLTIAHKLRDQLEATGSVRVLMTRTDDRFLTLSERVRVAREARADLFVSLHADSLSAAQEVRGATIYTGSERATDAESARLAQKENAADAFGVAEAGEGGEAVVDILLDLARRETRALSGAAAARLVTEMSGSVKMHRVPQRSAGFRVLTAPDVPSLLIELGFLSSKSDIALLTSDEWQRKAVDAMARAIGTHFVARAPGFRHGASISPQP